MSTVLLKNDVLVRLQLGACCAGSKLELLMKQLSYGGYNIDKLFSKLELLINRLEILEDIKTSYLETPATLSYDYSGWGTGGASFNLNMSSNYSTIQGLNPNFTVYTATTTVGAMASLT